MRCGLRQKIATFVRNVKKQTRSRDHLNSFKKVQHMTKAWSNSKIVFYDTIKSKPKVCELI